MSEPPSASMSVCGMLSFPPSLSQLSMDSMEWTFIDGPFAQSATALSDASPREFLGSEWSLVQHDTSAQTREETPLELDAAIDGAVPCRRHTQREAWRSPPFAQHRAFVAPGLCGALSNTARGHFAYCGAAICGRHPRGGLFASLQTSAMGFHLSAHRGYTHRCKCAFGADRDAFPWTLCAIHLAQTNPRKPIPSESENVTDNESSRTSVTFDAANSGSTPSHYSSEEGEAAASHEEGRQKGALIDPLLSMGFLRSLLLLALRGMTETETTRHTRRRKRRRHGKPNTEMEEEKQDVWASLGQWFVSNAESLVSCTLQGIIVFVL